MLLAVRRSREGISLAASLAQVSQLTDQQVAFDRFRVFVAEVVGKLALCHGDV